eukprot:4031206-Pleurochrysis_carterae.AAC.1
MRPLAPASASDASLTASWEALSSLEQKRQGFAATANQKCEQPADGIGSVMHGQDCKPQRFLGT